MAARIILAVPALICSMLAAAPALAEGPEDDVVALDPTPVPVPPVDIVIPPPEATALSSEPVAEYPVDDDYDPYVETYEPEPEATLELDSGYIGFGIGPGMTLHSKGFHPNTRFELEFGGTLEHARRDLALSFGVATHITPYYERKTPSYGADVTMTAVLGPVYLRTGLGALGGLPRDHLLDETMAAVGGVVGVGLTFGRVPMIRVGVDYDLRVNTKLEPVHTFFLAVRIVCCRKD